MAKLNPWLREKLKGVDPSNIRVIVEVDPKLYNTVVQALRSMGLRIVDTSFNTFITVVVPETAMIEYIERLPGVREVHYDAPVWIRPVDFSPEALLSLVKFDPFIGQIRVSEIELPAFKPPYPPVPFGALFMPRTRRGNVEIIPNTETKKIIIDIETTLSGRGVRVAAIDTGATPYHPQFFGKRVEVYTTIAEPPYDMQGHGQWVSTQIAGAPYNTRFGRVEGVAPAADIVHIKALSTLGFGTTTSVLKAMETALATGAKIVSMSLGGPQQGPVDHDPHCKAARILAQHGVLVIVAAGNEGPEKWTVASPGVCPDVVTVGAYSPMYDDVAVYSSRGPSGEWYREHRSDWEEDLAKYGDRIVKPDIIAPGGGPARTGQTPVDLVYSGVTGWFDGFYDLLADGFEGMRGTSMSTPHVSGLLALVAEAMPQITIDDVRRVIARGEKSDVYGYGLVRLSWFAR